MLKTVALTEPDEFFAELGKRKEKGVYFCRLSGYNRQIHEFLLQYFEAARTDGVIIDGGLHNPDNNNLAYYSEIMGPDFQMNVGFIGASLKKWLPRMTPLQRDNVAGAIYDTLMSLRRAGKNDNILKNAYVKFMCWLYYKFERIVNRLGNEKLPKILYEGPIGNYELLLLNVLAIAGCDILLLQVGGDAEYRKIDPDGSRSSELVLPDMTAFPADFSVKQLQNEIRTRMDNERLYGEKPQLEPCVNAWMTGSILEDLRRAPAARGSDQRFFCNCFCRIAGVEDRLTYPNELYRLQAELKSGGRKVVIASDSIAVPTVDEIGAVHRKNYQNIHQLIDDLASNLPGASGAELQKIMRRAFVDLMLEEERAEGTNLNRLTGKAVYLLCWLNRYRAQLFGNWKYPEVGCFFYLGGCRNENEALFCRFLARLPVDVVIFAPNLNRTCCLQDSLLYEVRYDQSLAISEFPEDSAGARVGTAAYHAERDLDTLMYRDSGLFRNRQYDKAEPVTLRTMYEEIAILWDQELKYRPNFGTTDDTVSMPVIFSKVCGVKDGELPQYWSGIRALITPETTVIRKVPHFTRMDPNPIRSCAAEFFRSGRLQRGKIKQHKLYRYGILREPVQDYMLDKLQELIDRKLIKGTFENGTEYTIIAEALNLDKDILRLIQNFDFTKKNPKLIYIITGEDTLSPEDTAYAAFLHLIGFDVLFFVPTGYRCVEKYLNEDIIEEHQIGQYMYDLQVPDLDKLQAGANTHASRLKSIFKRGT